MPDNIAVVSPEEEEPKETQNTEQVDEKMTVEQKQKSVVDTPTVAEHQRPSAVPIIFTAASASQTITRWGVSPAIRDKELRAFWVSEPWLASVVSTICGICFLYVAFTDDGIWNDSSGPAIAGLVQLFPWFFLFFLAGSIILEKINWRMFVTEKPTPKNVNDEYFESTGDKYNA